MQTFYRIDSSLVFSYPVCVSNLVCMYILTYLLTLLNYCFYVTTSIFVILIAVHFIGSTQVPSSYHVCVEPCLFLTPIFNVFELELSCYLCNTCGCLFFIGLTPPSFFLSCVCRTLSISVSYLLMMQVCLLPPNIN